MYEYILDDGQIEESANCTKLSPLSDAKMVLVVATSVPLLGKTRVTNLSRQCLFEIFFFLNLMFVIYHASSY